MVPRMNDPQLPSQACNEPNCCSVDRRQFLKLGAAGLAALPWVGGQAVAGPFTRADVADHFVPADKKLTAEWRAALVARGARTIYAGADLDTIAMPCGGLCAGQLYVTGDGRLAHWDILNEAISSGYGSTNYDLGRKPVFPVRQGFAVRVQSGGQTLVRALDRSGFPGVG